MSEAEFNGANSALAYNAASLRGAAPADYPVFGADDFDPTAAGSGSSFAFLPFTNAGTNANPAYRMGCVSSALSREEQKSAPSERRPQIHPSHRPEGFFK